MAIGFAKAAGLAWGAFNVSQPLFDIAAAKKEGHSTSAAIGKGLASYATFEMMPGLGLGLMAKDMIQAGTSAYKGATANTLKNAQSTYSHGFGGNFVDTQNAYTMRQRGLQAIQNNGINARSVLGNEARMYTRGRY